MLIYYSKKYCFIKNLKLNIIMAFCLLNVLVVRRINPIHTGTGAQSLTFAIISKYQRYLYNNHLETH